MDKELVKYLESLSVEDYYAEVDRILLAVEFVMERRRFARFANVVLARLPRPVLTAPAAVPPEGTRHWN